MSPGRQSVQPFLDLWFTDLDELVVKLDSKFTLTENENAPLTISIREKPIVILGHHSSMIQEYEPDINAVVFALLVYGSCTCAVCGYPGT